MPKDTGTDDQWMAIAILHYSKMSNEEATEQISTDSSNTKDEDEVVEEEEAKKLFDCQYLIPSHQIAYVLKWLQESFSLIELQVLKASLEKNDVASDESHIPNKLHSATYTEKGKQRIQILSQTIQMIQEVQQDNVHSQNIPDTIISKKYSEIPNDNEQMINQMEWNNIQYKAWSLQARTIPKKDSLRRKIYCLQQECQPWIEKLKNILIMLQHSIQYINTTDDNESLTLRPFTSECKKQATVCLRKLCSSTGRLMILVLAEHFSIQHINLVFQCFCSSNGQGRNKSLTKIPRMHTTPSGHKNYHLKQCNCRNHRSHDDTKELLRQIAAIKIQTSWRAAMTRNNMLFAISLEQLLMYVAVIFKRTSSIASANGKTNLYSLASLEEELDLVTLAKIREHVFKKYYYVNLHHCLQDVVGAVRESLINKFSA